MRSRLVNDPCLERRLLCKKKNIASTPLKIFSRLFTQKLSGCFCATTNQSYKGVSLFFSPLKKDKLVCVSVFDCVSVDLNMMALSNFPRECKKLYTQFSFYSEAAIKSFSTNSLIYFPTHFIFSISF